MVYKGAGMAIYKTRWFARWARKSGIADATLCEAVREIRAGLHEADLGGGCSKSVFHVLAMVRAAALEPW
jgi:hypothetical protein